MERDVMELNSCAIQIADEKNQRGIYLIELMIAIVVLMVGILGSMSLIIVAIGTNGRNRQQSNSTVVAQMITEKIMSVPASTSPTLTITDCSGAAQNINTTGSGTGAGATLLSSGDVDFSQTLGGTGAPAGYYVQYTTCGTGGRQSVYDVRWNIKSLSSNAKLVTISTRLKSAGKDPRVFAFPVTIRSMIAQGS
jgi:type II secretory pathway pseudopilin PulG